MHALQEGKGDRDEKAQLQALHRRKVPQLLAG